MTLYPNHPDVEKREMLRIDGIIVTSVFLFPPVFDNLWSESLAH